MLGNERLQCFGEDFYPLARATSRGLGDALSPPPDKIFASRESRRTGLLGTRQETDSTWGRFRQGGDIHAGVSEMMSFCPVWVVVQSR